MLVVPAVSGFWDTTTAAAEAELQHKYTVVVVGADTGLVIREIVQGVKGWLYFTQVCPDSKVHGANMGPIWGRQDPGGPHVGPMNVAIWVYILHWFVLQVLKMKSIAWSMRC